MPGRPPKEWARDMIQKIKKDNPDYTDEQARATMGSIWHKNLSESKKQEITKRKEGKLRVEAQVTKKVINILCGDQDSTLEELLNYVKQIGNGGHSFDIIVDPESNETRKTFFWDGDGADSISKIEVEDVIDKEQKTAQADSFMFPNLFSSEAKKWLEIQTKLEAVKILGGIVSTPEQALKAIDQAIDNISKQLSMAVEPEVKRIMDTQKDKIMDEIVVDTEQNVQQPAPPIPPNAPPAPAPAAQPTPQPAPTPAPVEPVEASASTYMPAKLRAAFDLASKACGEVKNGEWIVCGLEDGSNEGIPAEFIEKEMLEDIVKNASHPPCVEGVPGSVEKAEPSFDLSGSVLGDYTGLSKVASIEVRSGYGVRLKASEDTSPWIVFDKKEDADSFLAEASEQMKMRVSAQNEMVEVPFGVYVTFDLPAAGSLIKDMSGSMGSSYMGDLTGVKAEKIDSNTLYLYGTFRISNENYDPDKFSVKDYVENIFLENLQGLYPQVNVTEFKDAPGAELYQHQGSKANKRVNAQESAFVIHVGNNMGENKNGSALIWTNNVDEATLDQSIMGSMWEFDGEDFAYAVVSDSPTLIQDLEKDGYNVEEDEYWSWSSWDELKESLSEEYRV